MFCAAGEETAASSSVRALATVFRVSQDARQHRCPCSPLPHACFPCSRPNLGLSWAMPFGRTKQGLETNAGPGGVTTVTLPCQLAAKSSLLLASGFTSMKFIDWPNRSWHLPTGLPQQSKTDFWVLFCVAGSPSRVTGGLAVGEVWPKLCGSYGQG